MIISLISILTINHVIGRENLIPWNFSIDKHWFKYHTSNKPIIMGRKTFESIGQPLLNRLNIVLSNQCLFKKQIFSNICIVHSPEQAISLVEESHEVMVIGGGKIYEIFIPKCTRMYLTYIDCIYDHGDSWFPKYTQDEWKSVFNIHKLCKISKKKYYNLYFKILERY